MLRSSLTAILLLLALFGTPAPACPMCQEAVPNQSSAEDEDQARLSRAYNNSILFMVGVPYLLVGGVGFLIVRQVRLKAKLDQRTPPPGQSLPPSQGDLSCPTRSADVAS